MRPGPRGRWLLTLAAGAALGAVAWLVLGPPGRRDGARRPPDLSELRDRLRDARARDVEVRTLGDGIVELVGTAESGERAERLLELASRTPGVDVVVDRLWSPEDDAPRASRPGASGPAGPN